MDDKTFSPMTETDPEGPDDAAARGRVPPGSRRSAGDLPREIGGRDGPDPVRYGDWEKNGRCIDF